MIKNNIHPNKESLIQKRTKELFLNQRSKVLWFTGLSGSGKSSIAFLLEKKLFKNGFLTQVLDGDNIRTGISSNLGFSIEDRSENIRRVAELSKVLNECGIICLNCFISPTKQIRSLAKNIIGEENLIEIYINAPLSICEERDVKGLYKKARAGEIKAFSGIDSPFEAPTNPHLEIDTVNKTIETCVEECYAYILKHIQP